MGRLIDLTWRRFGMVTVVSRSESVKSHITWTCYCDCGSRKDIRGGDLKSGKTTSCGCHRREDARSKLRVVRNDPQRRDYYANQGRRKLEELRGDADFMAAKAIRSAENIRALFADEGFMSAHKDRSKITMARLKADEEFLKRQNDGSRAFLAKMREDPEWEANRIEKMKDTYEFAYHEKRMEQEQAEWEASNQSDE